TGKGLVVAPGAAAAAMTSVRPTPRKSALIAQTTPISPKRVGRSAPLNDQPSLTHDAQPIKVPAPAPPRRLRAASRWGQTHILAWASSECVGSSGLAGEPKLEQLGE